LVGIIVFLSVMPLAAALIRHRFVLQTSMVEEGARRLSVQRQFTSMVSHELRGPLTAIRGFAQLLMDNETSLEEAERAEIHGLIEREAENLNPLVDDILIVLRFESGNLHVAAENVNVRRAADEIMGALAHMARGNDVVIDVDPAHTAVGDEARIRQVIRNLVTNALKYGGTRIEITSELRGDTLHLSVLDDGDGIPTELRSQLFDDYSQGANADASTGYGLGLGFSRRLALLMDGDLVYEDAQPSEAHFTLALPAA
jgi:signal transduction histidine kinase